MALRQKDRDYIIETKEKVRLLYLKGMDTIDGIYFRFSQLIFEKAGEIRNTYGDKDYVREFYKEAHIDTGLIEPEDLESVFVQLYSNRTSPQIALLQMNEPCSFKVGKKYTVRVSEANSYHPYQEHDCTLYVYNQAEEAKGDINIEEIYQNLTFPEVPEECPFKNIVRCESYKGKTSLVSSYYGMTKKSRDDGNPDYTGNIIYEGAAYIEGYKPFEFVYTEDKNHPEDCRICGILEEEENHPRWEAYHKFVEEDRKERERQRKAAMEWLLEK